MILWDDGLRRNHVHGLLGGLNHLERAIYPLFLHVERTRTCLVEIHSLLKIWSQRTTIEWDPLT